MQNGDKTGGHFLFLFRNTAKRIFHAKRFDSYSSSLEGLKEEGYNFNLGNAQLNIFYYVGIPSLAYIFCIDFFGMLSIS